MGYTRGMRTAIPFDTHAFVKRLHAAGVPEPQAEVHAEALAELAISHLATKQDLSDMEARLDARFKELELRLTLRSGAMLAAAVAIVVALVKVV